MAAVGCVRTTAASRADTTVAVFGVEDMVLVVLDGLRREEMSKLMAARVLVSPLLHRVEHVTLNLNAIAAGSGVVECAENVIHDFVNGNRGVLPSI
jgi:hypothetical protein